MDYVSTQTPTEVSTPQFEKKRSIFPVLLVSLFWYVIAGIISYVLSSSSFQAILPMRSSQETYIPSIDISQIVLSILATIIIYVVLFIWSTRIALSRIVAKFSIIFVIAVDILFFAFFLLIDRPCDEIECIIVPPIILLGSFATFVTIAVTPIAGARLLIKDAFDLKLLFTKSLLVGAVSLLILFIQLTISYPRYQLFTKTVRLNAIKETERLRKQDATIRQLKSTGIFLDLKPSYLPKVLAKNYRENPNDNGGITIRYSCISLTGSLEITQNPRARSVDTKEHEYDGGGLYDIAKREIIIGGKQGVLYEKLFSKNPKQNWPKEYQDEIAGRIFVSYTDNLQIIISTDNMGPGSCPITDEEFDKIVQSIPLAPI